MDWIKALVLLAVGLILFLVSGLFPGVLATIVYVIGLVLAIVGLIALVVSLIRGGPTRI